MKNRVSLIIEGLSKLDESKKSVENEDKIASADDCKVLAEKLFKKGGSKLVPFTNTHIYPNRHGWCIYNYKIDGLELHVTLDEKVNVIFLDGVIPGKVNVSDEIYFRPKDSKKIYKFADILVKLVKFALDKEANPEGYFTVGGEYGGTLVPYVGCTRGEFGQDWKPDVLKRFNKYK